MKDPNVAMSPAFLLVAAVIGGGMGYLCGKMPLNAGTKRGQDGLGLAGMVFCVLCGMLGGCLLALPVALLWTGLISLVGPAADGPAERRGGRGGNRRDGRGPTAPRPVGAYTTIGPVILCNRCQQATSRQPGGGVPPACPHCQNPFDSIPTVRKTRPAPPPDDEVVPLEPADAPRKR